MRGTSRTRSKDIRTASLFYILIVTGQSHISTKQWAPEVPSEGLKRLCEKLTIYLHPVPSLRMSTALPIPLHTPSGLHRGNFTFRPITPQITGYDNHCRHNRKMVRGSSNATRIHKTKVSIKSNSYFLQVTRHTSCRDKIRKGSKTK